MDVISIYEAIPDKSVVAIQRLATDYGNLEVFTERCATDEVSVDDFVRVFGPLTAPKTGRLVEVFDDLVNDGETLPTSMLVDVFGSDSSLLFPPDKSSIGLADFVTLAELFDDDGNVIGIPESMLTQLRLVNKRIEDLNHSVSAEKNSTEEALNQISSIQEQHRREKDNLIETAAAIEEERNSLYDELKAVRRIVQMQKPTNNEDDLYEEAVDNINPAIVVDDVSDDAPSIVTPRTTP